MNARVWEYGYVYHVYKPKKAEGHLLDVRLDNGQVYRLVPTFEVWPVKASLPSEPPQPKPPKPAAPNPQKPNTAKPPPTAASAARQPAAPLPYDDDMFLDSSRAAALTTSLPLKKRSSMGAHLPVKKRYLKGQNREESNSDESDNEEVYDFEGSAEAVQQRLQRRQTQQQRRARASIGA